MGTALGFASGVATGGVVATGVSKLIVMTGEGGMPAAANGFAWGSTAGLGVDILIDDKMCKDGWWGSKGMHSHANANEDEVDFE